MGAVAYEESQEPIRRYRSINFSKAESLFRASSANEKHEWITSPQNQRVAASLEHRLARSSPTQPHAANCRQSRTRRSSSRLPPFHCGRRGVAERNQSWVCGGTLDSEFRVR